MLLNGGMQKMKKQKFIKILALATAASLELVFAACNGTVDTSTTSPETTTTETVASTSEEQAESQTETSETQKALITESDITVNEEIENSADGEHAIEASGDTASYSNVRVGRSWDINKKNNLSIENNKIYLDFRMRKCQLDKWADESLLLVERARGFNDDNMFLKLLQAQVYLSKKDDENSEASSFSKARATSSRPVKTVI